MPPGEERAAAPWPQTETFGVVEVGGGEGGVFDFWFILHFKNNQEFDFIILNLMRRLMHG